MKGILYKSKEGWMVKYTTYKTIPGIKGVMGSHSRMPESNYLPVHPDHILHYIKDGDEFTTVDFEIVEILNEYTDGARMVKYAKLINEEKSTKRSKQKKFTNVMEYNNIKRMYSEDDVIKLMSMATKWDTFKDGDVEYGMDMDSFFKYLIESLDIKKMENQKVEGGKDEEVLIELEEWNHTCGDGCCSTYGTNIYINGEQIEDEDGMNPHQLLQSVLTKLGYTNVKVEYK